MDLLNLQGLPTPSVFKRLPRPLLPRHLLRRYLLRPNLLRRYLLRDYLLKSGCLLAAALASNNVMTVTISIVAKQQPLLADFAALVDLTPFYHKLLAALNNVSKSSRY